MPDSRLIAPNRGEPIIRENGVATERVQVFLEEVERMMTSNSEIGDDALLAAGSAEFKGINALSQIEAINGLLDMLVLQSPKREGSSLLADYISLNRNPRCPGNVGDVCWNADENTIDVYMPGGVVLQVGSETLPHVANNTGSDIDNGTPLGFNGIDANGVIEVVPMIADGSMEEFYFVGIATQDIPDGTVGRATWFGRTRGLNTTGSPVSETWASGDLIYVSPTTTGTLTNIKPTAPNLVILVAAVGVSDSTSGDLIVRPLIEFNKHYGVFLKTSDASLAAANTAYAIEFDTEQIASGFNIDGTYASRIVAANSGQYSFSVSIQLISGSASAKNVWLWFAKNGADISNTTIKTTLADNAQTKALSRSFPISMEESDYVEIKWAADDTNISLDAEAATAFAPAQPAVILTIDQIQQ
jgi:hypothetical protein